jgi:hypothetical protein
MKMAQLCNGWRQSPALKESLTSNGVANRSGLKIC